MKFKIGITLLIFLLFISGCVKLPEDVIAPNWDVDFNIPITNKTYKLGDIIKPQKYIGIDSDSSYVFSSDVYNYTTSVDEFLDRSDEAISIEATVIAIDGTANIYMPFPGNIKLNKAKFKEGTISINGQNQSLAESITLNLNFPGFRDKNGNLLTSQLMLAPGDSGSTKILLNEYSYQKPASQPDSLDNGILVEVSISSGSNLTSAHVNFSSSGFKFKSATGYFPPKILNQATQTIDLNLGNDIAHYRGNIYLTGSFLKLKAEYKSAAPDPLHVELNDLQITGKSLEDNNQEQLLSNSENGINNGISSSGSSQPQIVDTVFDESNSNINDFISFLPDEIVINSSSIMNPDDNKAYKTVTDQDSVKMEAYLSTKGVDIDGSSNLMALQKTTITDTLELNIDQSDRDALTDGKAADISLQVKNAIPLTSWIKIVLTNKNYKPLSTITTNTEGGDSLKFLGAQVSSSNGNVTSSSQSEQMLSLSASQIKSMSEAYYVVVSVSVETSSFNKSNPVHVLLKASDWIEIQARGRVKYNVNPGD
jgi:hypothetical protein